MKTISNSKQSGAVSLFVVIFATLLITVVTVSFLRLMMNDQEKASNNDLSQSAYDSSLAGVEDAKRVLLRYMSVCAQEGQAACDALATQIDEVGCNNALRVGDVVSSGDVNGGDAEQTGEVLIQQSDSGSDSALDQAYTCVTISLLTDDYVGSLSADESKLIPLVGKSPDGSTDFDTVTVEWFSVDDLSQSGSGTYSVDLPGAGTSQPLLAEASWPTNRPSVMRTQLMQFGDAFTLESFDTMTPSGQSNANTVFLYPTSAVTASSYNIGTQDTRKITGETPPDSRSNTPLRVRCATSLSSGGYACRAVLQLPTPIGGGERTAYLRLTPMYNASHFRVTLTKSGAPVQFNGVQPVVDSTGRANDLFRRVQSRVDLIDTSFPYPDAAVDVTGNLCKDFGVTDSAYLAGSCTP
jgi:hypothetical protein